MTKIKMDIIYLHGFRSSAYSGEGKVAVLEEIFPDENVIPLKYNPHKPIETKALLKEILDGRREDGSERGFAGMLVGTSLGGFWTLYAAKRYGIGGVVINPSLKPYKSLSTGTFENYKDGSEIEVTQSDLDEFKVARNEIDLSGTADAVAYVAADDEILNTDDTISDLKNLLHVVNVIPTGEHRFTCFGEPWFRKILSEKAYTMWM